MLDIHGFLMGGAGADVSRGEWSSGNHWSEAVKYLRAGTIVTAAVILINLLAQGAYIMQDWWLAYWADEQEKLDALNTNTTVAKPQNVTLELNRDFYLGIYAGLTGATIIFGFMRNLVLFNVLVRCAQSLHNGMFKSILRTPVRFFDINPIGRILTDFQRTSGSWTPTCRGLLWTSFRTDELIRKTIRDKFRECTVLTIAHRLNTIIDSDRILVLDAGEIHAYDEPYGLPQDPDGIFYKTVRQTGKTGSCSSAVGSSAGLLQPKSCQRSKRTRGNGRR